jgi:hypothetical protein
MRDQVFVSYSHRDAAWLERLQVYLSPFERRGQVRRWDDTLIAPGRMWEQEILDALARAKVAVLLVSADFLASDFIARVELPRLLGAAEDEGVAIIPLVLDACNFERIPELAQFQSVNPPSQPLETLGCNSHTDDTRYAFIGTTFSGKETSRRYSAETSFHAPSKRSL